MFEKNLKKFADSKLLFIFAQIELRKMESTSKYISLLKRFLSAYSDLYGITRRGIFGSTANGTRKDSSDIDIFYEGDKSGLLDFRNLHSHLKQYLGVKVDFIGKHKYLNPSFLNYMNRNMVYV